MPGALEDISGIQRARDAGYTDDEIYSHLANRPEFAKAKEAGYSFDEVYKHMYSKAQEQALGMQDITMGPTSILGGTIKAANDLTPKTTEAVKSIPKSDFVEPDVTTSEGGSPYTQRAADIAAGKEIGKKFEDSLFGPIPRHSVDDFGKALDHINSSGAGAVVTNSVPVLGALLTLRGVAPDAAAVAAKTMTDSVSGLAEFAESGTGLATLGAATEFKAAQSLIEAGFAVHGAKDVGASLANIGMAKNKDELAQAITQGVSGLATVVLPGLHLLSELPSAPKIPTPAKEIPDANKATRLEQLQAVVEPVLSDFDGPTQERIHSALQKHANGEALSPAEQRTLITVRELAEKKRAANAPIARPQPSQGTASPESPVASPLSPSAETTPSPSLTPMTDAASQTSPSPAVEAERTGGQAKPQAAGELKGITLYREDENGVRTPVISGPIGESHADLVKRLTPEDRGAWAQGQIKHGFETTSGDVLDRRQAADQALKEGRITEDEHAKAMSAMDENFMPKKDEDIGLHSIQLKPEIKAEKPILPQPGKNDWQSRNRFVGEHFSGPPNSVVIQVRDLDSVPIGDGKPVVMPLGKDMKETADSVFSGYSKLVNAKGGSMRETLVTVLDKNGRAFAQMEWTPEGMRVAEQSKLEAAREALKQRQAKGGEPSAKEPDQKASPVSPVEPKPADTQAAVQTQEGDTRAQAAEVTKEDIVNATRRIPGSIGDAVRDVMLKGKTPEQAAADNGLLPSQAKNLPGTVQAIRTQLEAKAAKGIKTEPLGKSEAVDEPSPPGGRQDEIDQIKKQEMSEGPGAAASTEPLSTTAQINQLRENLKSVTDSPKMTVLERLREAGRIAETIGQIKDSLKTGLLKMKSVGQTIWDSIRTLPAWTDYEKAVGQWSGAVNAGDFAAREFKRQAIKQFPNPIRREAVTNWIQADGDEALLRERADRSTGKAKKGYEEALKLTEEEKVGAMNISQYLDSMLQQGIDAGLFKNGGVENYVTQLWKRPNPITDRLIADVTFSKVPVNLKFARQRIFGSYFEGEQAGFEPVTKDIADLITIYDNATNKTLAARAFVKNLHEGFARDGRPLVEISGYGQEVPKEGPNEATLIKPHAKTEETADYRELDHPALRGWKWAGTNSEGNPVMMQGNLLVHPDVYNNLKNTLGTSSLRQNFFKPVLEAQAFAKQTKLSISLFHAVQEGVHAVFHRINPFAPEKINPDEPLQMELMNHGLQVADYRPMQEFSEGLAGKGGLLERVPYLGKYLHAYNEWLFQDYIPGLKMSMAKHALDRNLQRYSKDLASGKINRSQIVAMTARQANAAFGELNYRMMARSQTFQDVLRATTLAPDFLEARARFVAQAFTRYGGEQRAALALMATTLYIGARVLNKTLDDDYHWNKPFSFVMNGKEYGLRTIAGDVQHLFTDPRSFVYNRTSPIFRAAMEAVTGRDDRGIKRSTLEQVGDMASWLIPIAADKRNTETTTQKILGATGIRQANYSSIQQANEFAKDWSKKNTPESKVEILSKDDKNYALTVALQNGNDKDAAKLIADLRKSGDTGASIKKRLTGPLTKTEATESAFVASLNDKQRKIYDNAVSARNALYQKYLELGGKEKTSNRAGLIKLKRR